MNLSAYISSGILEAYVLGELTESETREVQENLTKYPELKEELFRIEEMHEKLLMAGAVEPHPSLRQKVMDKLDKKKAEERPRQLGIPQVNTWRYAAAASIVLALVTSYLAYNYYSKWKSTQSELNFLVAENSRIADAYQNTNQKLDQTQNDLRILKDESFKKVVMKGTPNAPSSSATVLWNADTKEVYLSISDMKEVPSNKQYQLWAIVDGKPVDAGVFDLSPESLIKMKNIEGNVSAFAVTLEPHGGLPSPSLETMQVIGNI